MSHSSADRPRREDRPAGRAHRWQSAMLAPLLLALLAGCATGGVSEVQDAASAGGPAEPGTTRRGTESPAATLQARRRWDFPADGLRFDNLLPAARLSGVERLGEGRYRVHVAPETEPVNPSAWYGFRIHAEAPREAELQFSYAHGHRHRYVPKLSPDGREWREAGSSEVGTGADEVTRLRLRLEAGELRVFAQPPFLPEDFEAWSRRVAASVGTTPVTFGRSVQGRPLQAFAFGAGEDAPVLLVLGRQHPPENTGTQALLAFVEALAADTPEARAFRERVHVLVLPLLNPDGVVEGHWRGNANGVDLNRDWGPFAQPETRAVRDLLQARGLGPGRVAFAIDFHSTFRDVFYTVTGDPARAPGGLLHAWMAAMQARFDIDEKPSPARSAVFKNWAFCALGAASVTYEVGDATPAAELRDVARHAAHSLMPLLMDASAPAALPTCAEAA